YVAARHMSTSFEELMRFVQACRGDVDTIAAMAGALWGIGNGYERLPPVRLEARERLVSIGNRLYNEQLRVGHAEQSTAADSFVDGDGTTVALLTLDAEEVSPIAPGDALHARRLAFGDQSGEREAE
ncbi:MAG: ADP-ribosylglycohydrolase family protein, partial [Bacteroidota bacterium]